MKKRIIGGALSAVGLISIAMFEGFSPTAYVPVPGDVPTIGFGSTSGVQIGDTVTVSEGLRRLRTDVKTAENAVIDCVKVPLSDGEFDAYTSLAFNIGRGAFCSSTLVKKLNAGDYSGACEEIKRWKYFKGEVLPGLVRRREEEFQRCKGN